METEAEVRAIGDSSNIKRLGRGRTGRKVKEKKQSVK